jgi:secreted trypsin-like serine protease
MLCQIQTTLTAGQGDSGGPVFFSAVNPYQDAGVNFLGLLWGVNAEGAVYSPTNYVLNELSNWTYPWAYPFYSWVRY